MLITSLPLSVGSFFTSRSMLRSSVRAVASSRSMSSRETSLIEMKCRLGGDVCGRRSSRMTRISAILVCLLWCGNEQNAVDLVHLDELHLDSLVAGGRKVLADVVGTDRQLAVAAVDEHRQLDAVGSAVVEERLDPGADRAAGVEHVIDEHDGFAFERKVQRRRPNDGLRMTRRTATADLDVVAIERDVDGAQLRRCARTLLDQPSQTVRERDAASLDPD